MIAFQHVTDVLRFVAGKLRGKAENRHCFHVKINLKQSKLAYWIVGIVFFATAVSEIITRMILRLGAGLALGNYLLILPLLMVIFISAKNFSKLLNLGCKRLDFFKGCLPVYVIAAFCTTLVCLVLWLVLDPVLLPFSKDSSLYNLFDVFGFVKNGAAVAFIQMFALLLLTACVAHTLRKLITKLQSDHGETLLWLRKGA
jgi:hypothetical protein